MPKLSLPALRRVAHVLLCLPMVWLVYQVATQQLGADPAEKLVKDLGFNGACILWLCLAMTPMKVLTGWPGWVGLRRLLGLWSFAYLTTHLFAFAVFWAGLNFDVVREEITERPYILVGLTAWLIMVPLAITSTLKFRRRLGRKWIQLHKSVYLVALLGLVHIIWIAKLEYLQPLLFGVVLMALLALRVNLKNKLSHFKNTV